MKIISGSSNIPLAEKIAQHLQLALSPVEIFVFLDGERRVRIEESVLDEDVVIVQSTAAPVDQNYMELFFLVDSARRSGAKSVTLVVPYIGYQRQDHVFRDGEAVSMQVVIKLLESLKVDRVLTYDLHTIKIEEMFHIPFIHLSALQQFAQKIREEGWIENTILVSPDVGGINRIKRISGELGNMPYISLDKKRDLITGNIQVSEIQLEDIELTGKLAIIVDDMISSGSTIVKGAEELKKQRVENIYVFATHPVFSSKASQVLQDSDVNRIFVTDSVAIPREKQFEKLEILSISEEIAKELKNV